MKNPIAYLPTFALLALAGCGDSKSVDQQIGECKLAAVRLYKPTYPSGNEAADKHSSEAGSEIAVGDYIVSCMRARGYNTNWLAAPCTSVDFRYLPTTARCYVKAKP